MSEKNVEVMELIETLYSMVTEAWGVPLGNDKCIVEKIGRASCRERV